MCLAMRVRLANYQTKNKFQPLFDIKSKNLRVMSILLEKTRPGGQTIYFAVTDTTKISK